MAKFVIKKTVSPGKLTWELLTNSEQVILKSQELFDSKEACYENIKLIKNSINRYTRIVSEKKNG